MPNDRRSGQFVYSAQEWKPVARLIGGWRLSAKMELEQLAQAYLRGAARHQQNLREKKLDLARSNKISCALGALINTLEEEGIDFSTDSITSLKYELSEIKHGLHETSQWERDERVKGRADPPRDHYLQSICRFWDMRLMKPVTTRTNVDTGKAYGPMIQFLVVTSRPVLAGRGLTHEAARHVIRSYQRQSRRSHQQTLPPGKGWERVIAVMAKRAASGR